MFAESPKNHKNKLTLNNSGRIQIVLHIWTFTWKNLFCCRNKVFLEKEDKEDIITREYWA